MNASSIKIVLLSLALPYIVLQSSAQTAPCSDLFFSQYMEGSSFNKVIEIYNPSSSPLDLSNYTVQLYNNGAATPNSTFTPDKMLPAKGTYVIANSQADTAILNKADTTSGVNNFNGDDAIVLLKGQDTLDVIGVVGTDPGSSWSVGTDDTRDNTLVRRDTVRQGATDWAQSSTEWVTYPQDDTTSLGWHVNTTCGLMPDPSLSFEQTAMSVQEDTVTVAVEVEIANENMDSTSVDVSLSGGTATNFSDFRFVSPVTVTFPSGTDTNQTVTFKVWGDTISEVDETIKLKLNNPTNNASITTDSIFTLTIIDDDNTVTLSDIADYTTVDTTCTTDSAGKQATFQATVISRNYRKTGLEFFIHDSTGGIGVFSSFNTYGYNVQTGDQIQITGTISQFMGLTQISPDTIIELPSTQPLPAPQIVTSLDESTEAERVLFRNAWIVDTAAWDTAGAPSGFNVSFTNGSDTIAARIDDQMPFYTMQSFTDTVDVYGIGSQFSSDPCTGYQIYPTSLNFQVANPILSLGAQDQTVPESSGQVSIDVNIMNPDSLSATTVYLQTDQSSTADSATDFTLSADSVTFPAGSATNQPVTLTIINDAMIEPAETVVLKLHNPTNNAAIADSVVTITIEDDDRPLPEYTIGEVDNTSGPNCEADSAGVECVLTGIVHSLNFRGSGYEFYIQDSTGGIQVFSFGSVSGYSVQVGDELRIEGEIDQFDGVVEIGPDSIAVLSTGNQLFAPDTVTQLDETTEGSHVLFANAWLTDPQNWTDTASNFGFNVRFTNGTDTIEARVDNQSPFFNKAPLTDTVNVIGTATQFEPQSPYCDGYQLYPSRFDTLTTTPPDTGMDDTTGIYQTAYSNDGIEVFPNPAQDYINIELEEHMGNGQISLYNLQGRLKKRIQLQKGENSIRFELTDLPAGAYFLTVQTADMLMTEKLMKRR